MVLTRSQTLKNNQTEQVVKEAFSNKESIASFSDLLSRNHYAEPDEEIVQNHR